MELKFLPEFNRIILWRNTIQLFHKHIKSEFTGPFFEAGYKNYRIEPQLLTTETGDEKNPDIIAGSDKGWILVELTMSNHSKIQKLESYTKIDPRNLSVYGYPLYSSPPDIISSRLSSVHDGDVCQIFVKDCFDLKNEQFLTDNLLKNALVILKGHNLNKLPEIPISLVPEMDGFEIRHGLIDIVMQLFDPNCQGKTDYEMCEEGMERLFEKTGQNHKTSLMHKINREMDNLIKNHLSGYLEYKNDKYQSTSKFKRHPASMQYVSGKLQEWANPKQKTLFERFGV